MLKMYKIMDDVRVEDRASRGTETDGEERGHGSIKGSMFKAFA